MRPISSSGEAALPRSRKTSSVQGRRPSVGMNVVQPNSFFLAREEDVFRPTASTTSRRSSASVARGGAYATEESGLHISSDTHAGQPDSVYGVQSLEDALGEAFGGDSLEEHDVGSAEPSKKKRRRPTREYGNSPSAKGRTNTTSEDNQSILSSPQNCDSHPTRASQANTVSQPLTPLRLESPFPESTMPSTPKSGSFRSLRLSDEDDDTQSQAITSGGEEEDEEQQHAGFRTEARGSAPELVMPSLAMPSRRPFTERGKQMGRLKVAVAGGSGVGKTSLIRAIVRQCEDIVHLDPISTQTPSLETPQPSRRNSKRAASITTHITEIQASTKAYPAWWSDMEDSRVLRRRKSMGETVLERNVCFVDSPGFVPSTSSRPPEQPLLKYLETLFHRNAAVTELGDSDLLGVLSGAGGVQVDVVLYICQGGETLSEHDFDYMSKLSKFASVVPVIAKADTLPESELAKRRAAMLADLPRCGVNPSLLSRTNTPSPFSDIGKTPMPQDTSFSQPLGQPSRQAPFLISCLPGSDVGEMDASLLMSPSYSPPLVTSELQTLVSMLFDPENITKLRHISSRKFLQWRERYGATEAGAALALSPVASGLGIKDHLALARASPQRRTSSPAFSSSALISRQQKDLSPFDLSSTAAGIGQGLPDFTRASIRDHIFREERLAQVQLAKWASELQRGVRREREDFVRLVEGERAKWLLERVGEEVGMGRLGAVGGSMRALSKRKGRSGDMELPSWARSTGAGEVDAADPLGLCVLGDGVTRTGSVVLKVLGGGVLVGAVWLAICRAWGLEEKWVGVGVWW